MQDFQAFLGLSWLILRDVHENMSAVDKFLPSWYEKIRILF